MTWTKLGAEWPDEARDLPDAAYRLHVDALCYSNRRGYDLILPKRDLHKFAEVADPEQTAKELVTREWWEDRRDVWFIGVRFSNWQRTHEQVEMKRRTDAAAQRRKRLHDKGDHTECSRSARCRQVPSAHESGNGSGNESHATSAQLSERNGTAVMEAPQTNRAKAVEKADSWPKPILCSGCGSPLHPTLIRRWRVHPPNLWPRAGGVMITVGYCTAVIRGLEAELSTRAAVWEAVTVALEDGVRRHNGDPGAP